MRDEIHTRVKPSDSRSGNKCDCCLSCDRDLCCLCHGRRELARNSHGLAVPAEAHQPDGHTAARSFTRTGLIQYLPCAFEDGIASGMPPAEARREVLLRFGSCHDPGTSGLRRCCRRSPGEEPTTRDIVRETRPVQLGAPGRLFDWRTQSRSFERFKEGARAGRDAPQLSIVTSMRSPGSPQGHGADHLRKRTW